MSAPNNCGRISPFPYGRLYAVPASLTALGLILYHIAAFSCGTFRGYADLRLGYFQVEYLYGGCENFKESIKYTDLEFSGTWIFGRFIAALGALLVWIIFFAVGAAAFVEYPHPAKRYILIVAICMGVVAFFSFLLLVGLSGGYSLGGAGFMAIISAFVWTGAAVSMFYCMKKDEPPLAATGDSDIPAVVEKPSPTQPPTKESNQPSNGDGDPYIAAAPISFTTESVPAKYEDPEIQFNENPAPVLPVSGGGALNVDEYEDEVIGDNEPSIIYSFAAKKDPVKVGEDRKEEVVDQDEPEIHLDPEIPLYEEEQDTQAMFYQVEPEGKSVIKMDYEAELPRAKPKQGASARNQKPLEP